MFRLFCGIIVVLGFSYMGYLYSERQKDRLRQISSFCDGLTMLEFNIRYMNLPIAEALEKTSDNCEGVVKTVFCKAAGILKSDTAYAPGESFCKALDECKNTLCISSDEVEILKSFSKTLGEGDSDTEVKNIQAAKIRLSAALTDAAEEVKGKTKVARGISTLIGLFIVIVLF